MTCFGRILGINLLRHKHPKPSRLLTSVAAIYCESVVAFVLRKFVRLSLLQRVIRPAEKQGGGKTPRRLSRWNVAGEMPNRRHTSPRFRSACLACSDVPCSVMSNLVVSSKLKVTQLNFRTYGQPVPLNLDQKAKPQRLPFLQAFCCRKISGEQWREKLRGPVACRRL